MSKPLSVKWKILPPMALIFFAIMAIVTLYSAEQQKHRLLEQSIDQMHDVLHGYLDSMNAMMLTGTMPNRGILRDKLLKREDVLEARMLRGDAVSKLFGPGFEHEKPQDALDRRALAGESVTEVINDNGEWRVTVVEPFTAVPDRNGTNCLGCHNVPEGTVLGAGRLTYSLTNRETAINHDLLITAAINFLVMLAGLFVIHLILNRVVIRPLQRVKNTMDQISRDADLRLRVDTEGNDEFHQLATATNHMLARFQPTIRDLAKTMDDLTHSAVELASVTKQTREGVAEQEREANQLTRAIDELSITAEDVARNAASAENAASDASQHAQDGTAVVNQVSTSITKLADQVERTSAVVSELAEGTQNIGQVSDTISAIADQTNLLALNAAIEAARAGEQGRGFAVVADEVRNLAKRTQEATQQIQRIIEQLMSSSRQAVSAMDVSRQEARQSVDDANRAHDALTGIARTVEDISKLNAVIATAAAEQSAVTQDINRNIQAISDVSRQTAAGTDKTLEESEQVARIATQLDTMVNQFKV